eukprot:6200043-Pleurochrysis_carterae.AAC.2
MPLLERKTLACMPHSQANLAPARHSSSALTYNTSPSPPRLSFNALAASPLLQFDNVAWVAPASNPVMFALVPVADVVVAGAAAVRASVPTAAAPAAAASNAVSAAAAPVSAACNRFCEGVPSLTSRGGSRARTTHASGSEGGATCGRGRAAGR